MRRHSALVLMVIVAGLAVAGDLDEAVMGVAATLDRFHQAAGEADADAYFGLLSEHVVFMGTDVSERWSLTEFKAFAKPHFARGAGWLYRPLDRHVELSPDGGVAWFDEVLWNERYGVCRGTGVLTLTADGWRIAQYHLAIPIPADLTDEVTTTIRRFQEGADPADTATSSD